MITSAKFVNYIVETLNILRQEIISKNKLGLYDDNIHMENFICYILNLCYGYELVNLNENKANYPGIDLGDSKAKIGFQITSTNTSQKINSTLETFITYKCYKLYPNLKFFLLTHKQSKYSINTKFDGLFEFNPNQDILDFDDLYVRSMYLTPSKQKEIVEYIHIQVPYVSESIGVDYFNPNTLKRLLHIFKADDWCEDYSLKIEHNFGYIPQVCVMSPDGKELKVIVKKDEKYVIIRASPHKWDGKILLT